MGRHRRRADAIQPSIVDALRAKDYSVEVLSDVGRGVPDLLVGYQGATGQRANALLEVKRPGLPLNDEQLDWHDRWRGDVATVESPKDALRVMRRKVAALK